ncbi:MAG: hypothetical protein FJY07_09900 [Bacteroidetes bacterium]|nr:hypothetical protein [Bacteroidota bacterium]
MLGKVKVVFYSPFFHSLLITAGILFFLPGFFDRNIIESGSSGRTAGVNEVVYYHDLDNSGYSEKILSFFSSDSLHAIQFFDSAGEFIEQWNIHGKIPGSDGRLHFADLNHDGISEITAFALKDDTLILSCFNPFAQNEYIIHERRIAGIPNNNQETDFELSDVTAADMNKDGFDEVIFILNNSTFYQPRRIYIYNLVNDSLWNSPSTGIAFKSLLLIDLDNDGIPEITGGNESSGNQVQEDNIAFSNYSAWLVCYDRYFNLCFDPVEFPGVHSEIIVNTFHSENPDQLLIFYNHTGPGRNEPFAGIINASGEFVKKAPLPDHSKTERSFFTLDGNSERFYSQDEHGTVWELTPEFQFKKVAEPGFDVHPVPMITCDLDGDGKSEVVNKTKGEIHGIITSNNFGYDLQFELPQRSGKFLVESYQVIKKGNRKSELFIQTGSSWQTYTYRFNPLFNLRYPAYLAIYLLVTGAVLLLRYIQRVQMREKQELHHRIAELQLQSVNQQIDPHFTLNAFNSIATLLKKEKGETAYNYFMQFTDLIRMSLLTSDKIYRSLEEELKVVRNYLDIQKLRFGDRFEFMINVESGVDQSRMVPKMIVQTFTENAVKHGFKETKSGGLLNIQIGNKDHSLVIKIKDNGMGRRKAGESKNESTGIGISALDKYIDLLNRRNDSKIEKQIMDLYNDRGDPAGTEVLIKIP